MIHARVCLCHIRSCGGYPHDIWDLCFPWDRVSHWTRNSLFWARLWPSSTRDLSVAVLSYSTGLTHAWTNNVWTRCGNWRLSSVPHAHTSFTHWAPTWGLWIGGAAVHIPKFEEMRGNTFRCYVEHRDVGTTLMGSPVAWGTLLWRVHWKSVAL